MEEKITSLINSNKYHSAIFFAYCVDIRFLDQVVIPQLKRKGIINFLCFVDSQMINKSIEWISHSELKNKETYYLSAVESKGAFHPKILALFGENNIHINIGSGNLTYTGYGGNKENWLSFIFDNNNNSDAKILSELWNYISITTMMYNGVA